MDDTARALAEEGAEPVALREEDGGSLLVDLLAEHVVQGVIRECVGHDGESGFDPVDVFGEEWTDAE